MFTCSLYRGKPIKKPYSLLQRAAKACGVEAPTPTSVRHVAETKSAKTLDPNKHATYTSEDAVVEVVEAIGQWVEESLLKRLHQTPFTAKWQMDALTLMFNSGRAIHLLLLD